MTGQLSAEKWRRISSLLDRVLDLPESRQLDFIEQCRGDDAEIYSEVVALLEASRQAPEFLDGAAIDLAGALGKAAALPDRDFTDQQIGAYKLCEEIGRGGMGVVYRAKRIKGDFDQQVAIKLLWDRSGNSVPLAHFHLEQQLLAALDHPNIARLYDGGLTEEGLAYFVMEYVQGVTIDEYCRTKQLGVEARLRLLARVADTLAFAHKNLIVHCDIKPSNILVNGDGDIKLLDFGIARLLDHQSTGDGIAVTGQRMTPGYAAPEQLKNQNITVSTDVYQLGLVVYELLTGVRAYGQGTGSFIHRIEAIRHDIFDNIHHNNCHKTIALPSGAAERMENNLEAAKILRGDLDSIILKMLDLVPDKRYSSMEAFKNDYLAWLESRPVSARHGGVFYRTGKFARRHWQLLSTAAVFVGLICAYGVTVTWQAGKIERALERSRLEQNKAQSVSDFLVDVFKAADPNVAGLESITAKDLLEKGHEKILLELDNAPEIQTHILTLLGEIYISQGAYHNSQTVLEESLARYHETGRQNSAGLANTLAHLAFVYMYTGRYGDADNYFTQALELYRAIPVADRLQVTRQYAQTLAAYGHLQRLKGDYDSALDYVNQAIVWSGPIDNGYSEEYATALNNLVSIQHVLGDFTEARENIFKAIEIQKSVTGDTHSFYSVSLTNAAIVLTDMEYFDEARELANQARELQLKILGEDHIYVANTYRTLGILEYFSGNLDQAESWLRRDLDIRRQLRQSNLMSGASSMLWLGVILQDAEKFNAAENTYNEMMDVFTSLTDNGEIIGRGIGQQASLAHARGDFQLAKSLYIQALEKMPTHTRHTADVLAGQAHVLLMLGELPAALENARAALALQQRYFPAAHLKTSRAKVLLGVLLHRADRDAEAHVYLSEGIGELEKHAVCAFGNCGNLLKMGRDSLAAIAFTD